MIRALFHRKLFRAFTVLSFTATLFSAAQADQSGFVSGKFVNNTGGTVNDFHIEVSNILNDLGDEFVEPTPDSDMDGGFPNRSASVTTNATAGTQTLSADYSGEDVEDGESIQVDLTWFTYGGSTRVTLAYWTLNGKAVDWVNILTANYAGGDPYYVVEVEQYRTNADDSFASRVRYQGQGKFLGVSDETVSSNDAGAFVRWRIAAATKEPLSFDEVRALGQDGQDGEFGEWSERTWIEFKQHAELLPDVDHSTNSEEIDPVVGTDGPPALQAPGDANGDSRLDFSRDLSARPHLPRHGRKLSLWGWHVARSREPDVDRSQRRQSCRYQ